jgi:hypothetical protein
MQHAVIAATTPPGGLAFLDQGFLPALIGWSIAWIAAATVGLWLAGVTRFWRSFWFMSSLWCVVNIAIAITAIADPPDSADAFRSLLGTNIILNCVWIAIGIGLVAARPKDPATRTMLRGFGAAVITQGTALLAFDTGWFLILSG